MASLAGVVVQDIGLFALTEAGSQAGPTALALQGLVLVIAVGLVILGLRAAARVWLA